jgi:hypothetical protein
MCLPKFGGKQFSNIIIKIYGTYFCRYLEESINFLLGTLKNLKDRTAGFQATGLMAISVQGNISKHLGRIMEVIRSSLPPKDLPVK